MASAAEISLRFFNHRLKNIAELYLVCFSYISLSCFFLDISLFLPFFLSDELTCPLRLSAFGLSALAGLNTLLDPGPPTTGHCRIHVHPPHSAEPSSSRVFNGLYLLINRGGDLPQGVLPCFEMHPVPYHGNFPAGTEAIQT